MIKVYLDASVIIAAILSSTGGSAKVLQFVQSGEIAGITSQTVIGEVEKHSAKIKMTRAQFIKFIAKNQILIRKKLTISERQPFEGLVELDDAHVVAGAKLTRCDYLVTLDKKHLLKKEIKKRFRPLKIVNTKELLEEIV